MKKLLATLSALALALTFAACGKQDVPPVTTDDTSVSTADTTTDTSAETKETTASSETDAVATEGTTDAPATSETEETTKATEATEATTTEAPVPTETTTAPAETTETTPAENTATAPAETEATTEATSEETTAPETPDAGANAALEVLSKIWGAYPADNRFSAFGGDVDTAVMDGPGAMKIDAATIDRMLGFPQDSVDKIGACASLVHMLNANTFTCGAYRVKDGEDAAALAESIRANIQARRWMCGYPETLRILTVGDTLVSMFGNGKLIDAFVEAAQSVYPDLAVTVNEPIE